MGKKQETQFVYFRETAFQSFLSDLFSYGFLCGTVFFNYEFVGGSYFLNGVILILFMLITYSREKGKATYFNNKEEFKTYLKDL